LRRADDRRGDKAAIIDVELELIAGLVAQRDAGQAAHEVIQQVRSGGVAEIAGGERLYIRRDLVDIDHAGLGRWRALALCRRRGSRCWRAGAGPRYGTPWRRQRRRGNDVDFRKRDRTVLGKNRLLSDQHQSADDAQRERNTRTQPRQVHAPASKPTDAAIQA
jgi:hypothetical protein